MPGLSFRNASTCAGLRPWSNFRLSGERCAVSATATAIETGLAAVWAIAEEALSATESAISLARRIGISLWLVTVFYCRRRLRASRHAALVDRIPFFDQSPALGDSIEGDVSMATVVAPGTDRKSAERKFYTRMAFFLVALVLLGFGPSFYLRNIVPAYPRPNPTLPPAVILHGSVFTLWMLAIVAQTQLISARKHEVHMRLGKLTMLLAVLMIPVMYLTAVWQVARANQPPFTDPLTWTIVPLAVIIPFAVMVWNGWSKRRDPAWHKRSMLSASILVVMGPSIGRLPIAPPILPAFTIIFL